MRTHLNPYIFIENDVGGLDHCDSLWLVLEELVGRRESLVVIGHLIFAEN